MAFETHMQQLRELTQKLEQGDLPLEEAVSLYTQGMQLAAACQKELETAKLQMTTQPIQTSVQEGMPDGQAQ